MARRRGPTYHWLRTERDREHRDRHILSAIQRVASAFQFDYGPSEAKRAEWRFQEFMRLLEKSTDRSPALFRELLRLAVTDPVLTGQDAVCVVCHQGLPRSREEWPYSVLKHCYTKRHEESLARLLAEGRLAGLFVETAMTRGTNDVGPTDACWQCGRVVPVAEMYVSTRYEYKVLCPVCFKLAEIAGRAKEVRPAGGGGEAA